MTDRQALLSARGRAVLLRAVTRAGLAPTARATPPWTHRIDQHGLTLWLDPRVQERMSGPLWRWDVAGCGAALFHARASISAESMRAALTRFPEGPGSACFARLEPPVLRQGDHLDPRDDPAMTDVELTTRVRGFAPGGLADAVLPRGLATYLSAASALDGVVVVQLLRRDHCEAVAGGVGPEGWHCPDPRPEAGPGSWRDGMAPRPGRGGRVAAAPFSHHERSRRTMLLLGTVADDPMAWLRAGEALERVRLILSQYGYACSPLTRAVDVPEARVALRRGLGLTFQPQILLLVGRAAAAIPSWATSPRGRP